MYLPICVTIFLLGQVVVRPTPLSSKVSVMIKIVVMWIFMMIIKSDDSVDRGRIFISEQEIQFPSFDF